MKKKFFILSLSIAVLFLISVSISPVNAGSENVNWQVAGSIANYVMVLDTDTNQLVPHYLISLSAKGRPGVAELTLMGFGVPVVVPPAEPVNCSEGEIEIRTVKGDMVARFPDLSLLFASIDETNPGYLCLDPVAGHSTFVSNMVIISGTGRFDGATGAITGTGDGYYFPSGGALAGEVGEITGEIFLP
jgi:hypothetical protein